MQICPRVISLADTHRIAWFFLDGRDPQPIGMTFFIFLPILFKLTHYRRLLLVIFSSTFLQVGDIEENESNSSS
jgi:hypothetical protein